MLHFWWFELHHGLSSFHRSPGVGDLVSFLQWNKDLVLFFVEQHTPRLSTFSQIYHHRQNSKSSWPALPVSYHHPFWFVFSLVVTLWLVMPFYKVVKLSNFSKIAWSVHRCSNKYPNHMSYKINKMHLSYRSWTNIKVPSCKRCRYCSFPLSHESLSSVLLWAQTFHCRPMRYR